MKASLKVLLMTVCLMGLAGQVIARDLSPAEVEKVIAASKEIRQQVSQIFPSISDTVEAAHQQWRGPASERASQGAGTAMLDLTFISEHLDLVRSSSEARTRMTSLVSGHGFSSIEDWGQAYSRVARAFDAYEAHTFLDEMEKSISLLKAAGASEQQLEQYAAQTMGVAQQRVDAVGGISDQDRRLVRRFHAQLSQLLSNPH